MWTASSRSAAMSQCVYEGQGWHAGLSHAATHECVQSPESTGWPFAFTGGDWQSTCYFERLEYVWVVSHHIVWLPQHQSWSLFLSPSTGPLIRSMSFPAIIILSTKTTIQWCFNLMRCNIICHFIILIKFQPSSSCGEKMKPDIQCQQ